MIPHSHINDSIAADAAQILSEAVFEFKPKTVGELQAFLSKYNAKTKLEFDTVRTSSLKRWQGAVEEFHGAVRIYVGDPITPGGAPSNGW